MNRNTRRHVPLLAALALSLGLAACSSSGASSSNSTSNDAAAGTQTIVIRAASGDPATSPTSEALTAMAKTVEQETNGHIKFDLYYYNELGSDDAKYTLLKQDSIQVDATQPGYLAADIPAIQAVNLPYAFENRAATYKALDGPAGSYLDNQILAVTHTARVLGWGEYGSEGIMNKVRPVSSAADLKGLKIRPAPGDIAVDDLTALGAVPTNIDFTEMYTGLLQGVVQGGELPLPAAVAAKLYEVAKYWTNTQDFLSLQILLINNTFFKSLSASDQKIITNAATAAMIQERANNNQDEIAATKTVETHGGVVTVLTPAQFAEFRTAVAPVDRSWVTKLGPIASEFLNLADIHLANS